MYTTQELAAKYGVTPKTITRWIAKVCDAKGINVSDFGQLSQVDKRVRLFSDKDLEIVQEIYPLLGQKQDTADVEVEIVGEQQVTSSGLTRHVIPTIATRRLDLSELREATEDTKQVSQSAIANLQELGYMIGAGIGAQIVADMKAVAATIEHSAVAGITGAMNPQGGKDSQL